MLDLLKMSLLNLGRKRSRSFMTAAGIAIGVASVVLIATIGEIGKNVITGEIDSLGIGGLLISKNNRTAGIQLGEEELEIVRSSGAVDSAIPVVLEYTKVYMRELMMDSAIWGIDYGANQVFSLKLLHGRLITKNDVTARKKVCVVDQNIARAFYKRDNIVGKILIVKFAGGQEELEIVGVVASGGNIMQGIIGEIIPCFVYMPYTSLQLISGKEDFDQIAVSVKKGVDGDVAGGQIAMSLSEKAGVKEGFKAENMASQKKKLDNVLGIITVVLSAIAGVSLVVSGLSIINVMMVSVTERTREIGIKKSIGASRINIMAEFLTEAFAISFIGSIAGTAIGIGIIATGCLLFDIPIVINWGIISFCIFFSVFVGVVFGVYPASVAAKLRPVDALRFD